MYGRATALGADTVLDTLAMATDSVFAIDAETTASVELDDSGEVRGSIAEAPDADTHLVKYCIELAIEASGDGKGGTVKAKSDLPTAASLKGSGAATNVTVLATLSTLGRSIGPGPDAGIFRLDTCRIGVRAAREVGVTAIGAFDDAAVFMVGDIVVTDNTKDDLIARDEVNQDVLVWTPSECAYSADADVSRYESVAPMAGLVADLAFEGRYAGAMAVDGLAFSVALDFPTDPAVETIPIADDVSLSGAGPSVVTVDDRTGFERVKELQDARERETRLTTTRTDKARIR